MPNEVSKDKNYFQFLSKLSETITRDNTIQKSCENLIKSIKDNLFYDLATIHLFNIERKLQLRANFGIKSFHKDEQKEELNLDVLKRKFVNKNKILFIKDWNKEVELSPFFSEFQSIKSIAILPLVYSDYLIGIISLGYKKMHEFKITEIRTLDIISSIFTEFIGSETIIRESKDRLDELNSLTRRMRHDFANDIQSIALALELLSNSELTEEQQKYIRILNNAKNSAIQKLNELKNLKQRHESDINSLLGLSLKQ